MRASGRFRPISTALATCALGGAIALGYGCAGDKAPVADTMSTGGDVPMSRTVALPDSLPNPTGPGSAEPELTVGPNGDIYLSWLEGVDSTHALRFAKHDGARWSDARTIVSRPDFVVNWADFPSLHVLDDTHLAAHWLQRIEGGKYAYGVRIAMSNDGGATWGAPIMPHRDSSPSEHGFVSMWTENGALGAAWLDGRKPATPRGPGERPMHETMVMAATISTDGTLGAESPVDQRTCDCCQTAAAMTSKGPIVAYRDRSPDEIRDIYVARRVDGKWLDGKVVHADNWKIAACPVNGPAIAANGDRVALAWFTAPEDSARVYFVYSNDAGATFGAPIRIDAGTPAGRVDVALLPDGAALVTWLERLGGDTAEVRVRRVARDGTASTPFTVAASSAARASGFPRIAVSGSHALFAWTVAGSPSRIGTSRVALDALR